ncbi:MAG: hypothetical protein M1812_000674 [Candelaria pacifica]|nr:MAG: hypothetical protein M1812_000674 [Candelaria pacifica]
MESTSSSTAPLCVGSTFDSFNCSTSESAIREAAKPGQTAPHEPRSDDDRFGGHKNTNLFKSAQWSPDGTCILTNSEDNHLRTFVLPVNLLEGSIRHEVSPYSILPSAEPVYSTAIYPHFNLQDPSTTLYLSAPRDHPIRLTSALHPTLLASYPLISPTTEKYLTPHSLLFTPSGTRFLTGSDCLISIFDISRLGSGPIERHATIPSKRKKIVGGGVGMKGIVSCLNISRTGLLAAGTFTRNVGLYDSQGSGGCVAVFSVADSNNNEEGGIGGAGITQVLWSPCGTYLYVVERKSDGVLVYDIRVAGRRLGCLKGRKADTNQRLGVDVVDAGTGDEIWAGGTDGVVRVWKHVAQTEGSQEAVREWKAHDDPVTSTVVHPSGSVVATCSGQRHDFPSGSWGDDNESEDSDPDTSDSTCSSSLAKSRPDNSLKIWWI